MGIKEVETSKLNAIEQMLNKEAVYKNIERQIENISDYSSLENKQITKIALYKEVVLEVGKKTEELGKIKSIIYNDTIKEYTIGFINKKNNKDRINRNRNQVVLTEYE